MPRPIKKIKQVKKTRDEGRDIYDALRRAASGRRTFLIAAASAVILIIAVVGGILLYRANQQKKFDGYNYNGYKLYYNLYGKTPLPDEERMKEALDNFQKAYAMEKNAYSLYYIGASLYGLGKYDDAIKTFQELIDHFPYRQYVPLAYYKMAMAAMREGRQEDALKYLQSLSNYRTGAFGDLALYESGRVLEGMGRKEEAQKQFEMLRKQYPNSAFSNELERPQPPEKK